jgi:outer membrane protein assembly factor BamB
MVIRRRFSVVLLGAGLLAAGFWRTLPAEGQGKAKKGQAQAQPAVVGPAGAPKTPAGVSGGDPSQFSGIKLVEKSEYRQFINAARNCIEDKEWNDAVTALQVILDNKEDFYVQVKERDRATGQESVRWTSVKFEANNLLGSMPDEGLNVYEVRFGGKARQDLEEAKKTGDRELLAQVAQRYLHTRAGAEANDLLATSFLDRGQFFMAALRYERLLGLRPDRVKLGDLTLFKAALAYRRAGDVKHAAEAWKRLEAAARAKGGIKLGDQVVPLAKLQEALDAIPRPEANNPHDWPRPGGNLSHSAQANGSQPILDVTLWSRPTLQDKSDETGDKDRGVEAEEWLRSAIEKQKTANTPVMSGFFPVAAADRLFYRTYTGVSAVWLKEHKDNDGTVYKPGSIHWKSTDLDGSLGVILSDANLRPALLNWLGTYNNTAGFSSLVYENSAVGAIATDHRLVYTVDDLAIPAPPAVMTNMMYNPAVVPEKVKPLLYQNVLYAFELETGRLKWRLGQSSDDRDKTPSAYAKTHFLGTPVAVGGKLYVLNETDAGDLRLLCIDPMKYADPTTKREPVVLSVQTLGTVQPQFRTVNDVVRRTHTVHLGYGEGILVCPTNAGQVLGIDLLSRSLAWAYPYRERSPRVNTQPFNPGLPPGAVVVRPGVQPMALQMSAANWKAAPPVITDGKVVFTAPDSSAVHCINLRDGTKVWKASQQEQDLFLAGVFQGKVLLIGKNSCRALRLSDGAQLWALPTGDLPSGQGIASQNVYYLPLRKGEICAIDVERGQIKSHNRTGKSGDTPPGNLVFYEGAVLSQTPREVVAYAQLSAKLAEADAAVAKRPDDAGAWSDRGELRLADGQVQGAVDDLHAALAKNPQGPLTNRVRTKLYEALTDLFQLDFDKASAKYLDEYRALCKVPDKPEEQQQREARFLQLLGQGREKQGDLVAAFQAYREFGALPLNKQDGVAAGDDPTRKIPTHVWLRGRVAAMIAKATPEQRRPLEDKIAREWQAVRAKNDIDAIRSFVGMFDVPFQVGHEARLQLAGAIVARNDRPAFLEAELNLQQLRGSDLREQPQIGGRALEELARLEVKKGTPEAIQMAAAYYRRLGTEYAKAVVRDGKTGADLAREVADPRLLLYMGEAPLWANAKIEARELPPNHSGQPQAGRFIFQPEGERTPFARHHRLELDASNTNNPQLRLVDITSGAVRWTQALGNVPTNLQYFQFLYQQGLVNTSYHPDARFRFFHVKGHLAVLQVGTMAYGLDLENPRILWQHSLLEGNAFQAGTHVQQFMPDAEGNLTMMVWNQASNQRYQVRLGYVGTVQASYVGLLTDKSLVVLDPLRGTTLWSRPVGSDSRVQVFGDDQLVYLVTSKDAGGAAAGRALRANDGVEVAVPDFGPLYQQRVRVLGRDLLVAQRGKDLVLRLCGIKEGKDRWQQSFDAAAVVCKTEDPRLTGVIEPDGKLTVVDLSGLRVVLRTSVLQHRVTADDVKNLRDPLLLADDECFYVALNRPVDPRQVSGGIVSNNFSNGLRCALVNGWFCSFHRRDGQRQVDGKVVTWKQGDMAWHSYSPITNQLVVLEQFEALPVILFSARYHELINGGVQGGRWVSVTQSLNKRTGKMVYAPPEHKTAVNMAPQFHTLSIDAKVGTITLIGVNGSVQHYVDDGRKQSADARDGYQPAAGLPPVPATGGVGGVAQPRVIFQPVPAQVVVPVQPVPPVPKR